MEGEENQSVLLHDVPRRIVWGRRSHLDATAWICDVCQHQNEPTRHLFVDLPAFSCGNCDAKAKRVNFRFSFGNLAGNGKCPIGKILDQGNTDDCLLFALAKGTEITARIRTILSGSKDKIPTLDPYRLKKMYKSSRLAEGTGGKISYKDAEAMMKMIELLETNGIPNKARTRTYKIGGVDETSEQFEDIATELANGYPLIVDIFPGSGFSDLSYREVYKCPFNYKTKPAGRRATLHTVILVGAGRWNHGDYYYFLNSYGEHWCVRIHKKTHRQIGGIGKICPEDICFPPYKFFRCM